MDNSNSKNSIIIISPTSSISKRTRLYKLAIFLYESGIKNITHIGWERIKGEHNETLLPFKIKKEVILKGGGYGGPTIRRFYFFWMAKLFFKSFSINKRSKVWALGFESAFPLLLASKIKGFKLYFDDADRFSMLINFPFFFNKIIQSLEKLTSRLSFKHIIPVVERYDFTSNRFHIIRNSPSKSELLKAKKISKNKKWIKASLVININGWLGKGRGMKTALDLYNSLINDDIAFILAGRLDSEEAIELSKKDKVQFLGEVSNAEALASYLNSDLVYTYYDPLHEINRYAASNKWGDAIKTETGIIVNSEVKTADYLKNIGMSISFPYHNTKDLSLYLSKISRDSSKIEKFRKNANKISEEFECFEDQLKKLFYETKKN